MEIFFPVSSSCVCVSLGVYVCVGMQACVSGGGLSFAESEDTALRCARVAVVLVTSGTAEIRTGPLYIHFNLVLDVFHFPTQILRV